MKSILCFITGLFIAIVFSLAFYVPIAKADGSGSWGCPSGWTTNPNGSCSFDGGGGGSGGSGSGGSWDDTNGKCYAVGGSAGSGWGKVAACSSYSSIYNKSGYSVVGNLCTNGKDDDSDKYFRVLPDSSCGVKPKPPKECPSGQINDGNDNCIKDPTPPPDFPDVPPPDADCDPCQALYDIKLKLNHLKNVDINNITNVLNDMSTIVNNIDNSITDLSVNQQITNNYLTNIDNSIGDIITNIENNNITNNEIKNEVTNIKNVMNDYSLKLGDIELAMGDIDLSVKNTNKLVLDLGLDLDFIKNKLVNDDSKDYTPYLEQIIDLLAPCTPTPEKPCDIEPENYDDAELIALLTLINDYMTEEFEPSLEDTTVPVTDLTNIELDRDLIKFGAAQCPPDEPINTTVNGLPFSTSISHTRQCNFFVAISPFVKSLGGFIAALTLGGGLRRG
ncbi:MAG: beta-propeller domains of methanol dehydrogenase type [Inoviridae sp.]|nr:MAG: beta-propeller domains of methanol dehydrogenase type [Inoviridae sp.]